MNAKRRRLLTFLGFWLLVAALITVGLGARPAGAGARNPCQEAGNLTQNCGFDTFADHSWNGKRLQVPQSWGYFILKGDLDFRPSNDTYWGAPSLWLAADGVAFSAGVYQQVQVTPGVVYQTDIGWAAARCNAQHDPQVCPNMERRLGLDPTGGINPQAASVVWSRIESGGDPWPDLTVSARASGPTMTVFVWVNHPSSLGLDEAFLDAVGLWPDTSQPAATVTPKPSPTPTRRPPTQTPKPAPPTETPTELPSPTPTDTEMPTATPTPTDTPTATATPTWTLTPTPVTPTWTPFPTRTPLPTVVPVAVVLQTAEAERDGEGGALKAGESSAAALLVVALLALVAGAALAGLLVWLWRRSRTVANGDGKMEEDE